MSQNFAKSYRNPEIKILAGISGPKAFFSPSSANHAPGHCPLLQHQACEEKCYKTRAMRYRAKPRQPQELRTTLPPSRKSEKCQLENFQAGEIVRTLEWRSEKNVVFWVSVLFDRTVP
jgi:hypothetical protein